MPAVKVNAFLQRNPGLARVRLWLLSTQHADVAWFRDLDYSHALREETERQEAEPGEARTWGAFEASFFGPDFQAIAALSRVYDEQTLNYEFTRATWVDFPEQMPSTEATGGIQSR